LTWSLLLLTQLSTGYQERSAAWKLFWQLSNSKLNPISQLQS